jgi:hypothetical protein
METYTWTDLEKKSESELDEIKKSLQEQLYQLNKAKMLKIRNILTLQTMINNENNSKSA